MGGCYGGTRRTLVSPEWAISHPSPPPPANEPSQACRAFPRVQPARTDHPTARAPPSPATVPHPHLGRIPLSSTLRRGRDPRTASGRDPQLRPLIRSGAPGGGRMLSGISNMDSTVLFEEQSWEAAGGRAMCPLNATVLCCGSNALGQSGQDEASAPSVEEQPILAPG
eukprot:CAMPEP_0114166962 /NCGR_PEP_ID=MMETSP0043_2-20121206/32123_1 /TAXON_ID=464988 /ORGANISM="Hemiselmis andersenii, Strain CCMP644" /LENGTH=167 /DNA_ID=CAMNT_0001264009 /DNA_START=144 /DNA_END=644 /DNA_ORIENTATION=+